MRWITRSDVRADRVACPWLIKRFIDPDAEFVFVPEAELLDRARALQATPFDAPRLPEVVLNHRGERCTFETLLEEYKLDHPALTQLGLIVRAADVKGQEYVAPEGTGLRAIALGFAWSVATDAERLARQWPVYEALYEYVRRQDG